MAPVRLEVSAADMPFWYTAINQEATCSSGTVPAT